MLPRESVLQYTERLQLLRFSKSTRIQCDYVANFTLIYLSLYCYLVLGQSWNMGVCQREAARKDRDFIPKQVIAQLMPQGLCTTV